MFVVSSFVRPTTTELYALKHNDITVETEPKRLLVTVRDGKTGFRVANTMPDAVATYKRLRLRYPNVEGEDNIFLPGYANRATAARIIQRQFNSSWSEQGSSTTRSPTPIAPSTVCDTQRSA